MVARPLSIMVGYDGTDSARRALDAAAELAGYGSTLAVVAVTPDGAPRNGSDPAADALEDAREHLLRSGRTARYLHPVGEAGDALVAAAGELEVDLLVVGSRPNPLGRLLPGSVSATVVRRAPCDVLVVR